MNRKTLTDTSNWLNGEGILSVLTNNYDVPWKGVITGQSLDDDYYGNRSGSKILAPLPEKLSSDNGTISPENMVRLATSIFAKYSLGWDRAWKALNEDYNPIWNVDGTDTTTTTETYSNTKTGDEEYQDNGTNTGTIKTTGSNTGTQTTVDTNTGTQTLEKDIYGFNSNQGSDSDKETTTNNLTDNNTRTDNLKSTTDTTNDLKDSTNHKGSSTDTEDGKRETKVENVRSGNIGVTSTQSLLTQEIEFREKYNFFDTLVYPNLDEVLVLNLWNLS